MIAFPSSRENLFLQGSCLLSPWDTDYPIFAPLGQLVHCADTLTAVAFTVPYLLQSENLADVNVGPRLSCHEVFTFLVASSLLVGWFFFCPFALSWHCIFLTYFVVYQKHPHPHHHLSLFCPSCLSSRLLYRRKSFYTSASGDAYRKVQNGADCCQFTLKISHWNECIIA